MGGDVKLETTGSYCVWCSIVEPYPGDLPLKWFI
jgi:hypothetical protein